MNLSNVTKYIWIGTNKLVLHLPMIYIFDRYETHGFMQENMLYWSVAPIFTNIYRGPLKREENDKNSKYPKPEKTYKKVLAAIVL